MEKGRRLKLTRNIRSAKTGKLLPREGTLVSVSENLGRKLFLIRFDDGQYEYVFEHEVESEPDPGEGQQHNEVCVSCFETGPAAWPIKEASLVARKHNPSQIEKPAHHVLRGFPPTPG